MRIPPIMPTQPLQNPPRQRRAMMSIRWNDHTVIDSKTGKEYALPAHEAWELFDKLNREGL